MCHAYDDISKTKVEQRPFDCLRCGTNGMLVQITSM